MKSKTQSSNTPPYRGIAVPILTPFKEDQSIDFPVLEKLVDWLCQSAVSVLFPMGGSGEYSLLSVAERKEIIDCIVRTNGRRRLLFAGTGADSLAETLELTRYAQKAGCDGVGVVIPTHIPGTQQAIFEYYQAVDEVLEVPFMVYDPRGEGEHSVTPETMSAMVDKFRHLVAIKYRTLNGERMGLMTSAVSSRISVFSGSETVFLQDLSVGAVGCRGGGANFYPQIMEALQDCYQEGDLIEARRLQFSILEAIQALNPIYWPLSGKLVLQVLGIPIQPVTRQKGETPSAEAVRKLQDFYRVYLQKFKARA